jgi:hypothetical protein
MKNLLIYQHPSKSFQDENEIWTKIQIDNSLALGWKPEDILLVTNFPYEYEGVKAFEVDKGFLEINPMGTKMTTLAHLFDIGFFKDELYWCHDLDAFQLEPITEEELELDGFDAGFNDYCRTRRFQMGTYFFKKEAEDIFQNVAKALNGGVFNEEIYMNEIMDNNFNNMQTRVKMLNPRYDFGMRKMQLSWEKSVKPIKIVHFRPHHPTINTLKMTMYGKNRIHVVLLPKRLIDIFWKYGIK